MDVERLKTALLFNGRYATESQHEAAERRVKERAEAAAALAKLQAERDHNWQEYLDERSARMAENNRNYRLTEALRPFAVWADKMPDVVPELSADIMNVLRFAVANGHLTGAHFRAASRALGGGALADPNATRTGDGGWLFVKSLFAPRTVTRLFVPGAGPDGMHRIEVEMSDGSSVMVTGVNHQAAWQSLADAAAAGRALGGGE